MAERGVNKVIIVGRLGKDPEGGSTQGGEKWCNFSVATGEAWKDKQTGELQERVEWHKVSIFGKLAEICLQYLRKGSQVYLEGSNRTRKWQDKTGQDRWTTEVVCHQMQMLGGKPEGAQGGAPRGEQQRSQPATGTPHGRDGTNFDDSDIPF